MSSTANLTKLCVAAAFAALGILAANPAGAADPASITITLGADAFTPAEVKVPANQPFVLKFDNKSPAAAEIEAQDLKIEKVVAAGGEIIVNVKPQPAGRYLFVNEYKEDTVKGYIVVE